MKTDEPSPDSSAAPRINWRRFYLFVGAATLITLIAIALLVNIFERKREAKNPFFRVVELTDDTEDPEVWGKNFPFQYDAYKRTTDQERTRYVGSEAMPRTPTKADPRSIVSQSRLEEDPRLKTMWAGYAFARDFREERGHAFMLTDQIYTERQKAVQQPGACIHCHGSVYVPYRKAGNGDLIKGFEHYNPRPYLEVKGDFKHPIACIDCHAADTMALRVTRPGFIEGMRALKAAQGVKDYDVNRDATRQEMRSFVCGQCHVEYYFKGEGKIVTYPWANGVRVEEIEAYYDREGFTDWVHAETGTKLLKAQHPEFEVWQQGIHARAGVACADCHMPYQRVGALKVSDHWVRSPLLNINRACQTCHAVPEGELAGRVLTIQDRHHALLQRAARATTDMLDAIVAARKAGASDKDLEPARARHRQAQWRLDFVAAENSMGFHAPQELARILAEAIDFARQGQREAERMAPRK
jgi:nitrite reductase (cytochrome c-552)